MAKAPPFRVRFGEFELNVETGELAGGGQTVQLGEKPLRVLTTLIERDGQLVTRETLQEKLWPNDTVVDFEHGINTAIKVLRRALGDSADSPKFIETIPRRGYRFIVPIEWLALEAGRELPGDVAAPTAGQAGKQTGSGCRNGDIVSHYRLLEVVGGGGMGVVYRAEDIPLGRPVAVKFLSDELGGAPRALERFHREARAVSLLDHPNICPIYEFGEHEGKPFIVMPLLEGKTLRDRLLNARQQGKPIPLEELLNIGIEVSYGLQAAHEKGITHRDVKPANIFLTRNGHSKILDFGLATVVSSPESNPATAEARDDPTAAATTQLTRFGAVIGTISYMSPEQASGKDLDARTDLFSFGAVLYEMATGKEAFSGEGSLPILKAVLEGHPAPASRLNPEVPPELERIINKALEKDRNLRYQSAAEIKADLTRLKRDSDPTSLAVSATASSSGRTALKEKTKSLLVLWTAAALLIAALAAGFIFYRMHQTSKSSPAQWERLTAFSDGATQPALSPDGKMVTFIRGPETFITPGQIYLKMLPDGAPVQLTHDNLSKMAPAFSPDGSRIAYTAIAPNFSWDTWVVPVFGGEPRMLLPNSEALTWTGKSEVVFSEIKTGTHMAVSTSTESRSGERDVYVPADLAGMAHRSWVSPDHKWVLVSEMGESAEWFPCRLVPFDGRNQGIVVGPQSAHCTYAAWSPDGKTMYFSADAGDGYHIWRQRFPSSIPEQITSGVTGEEGIAISPDGRFLISSVGIRGNSAWIHDQNGDRQIFGEGYAMIPGLGLGGGACGHSAFSPDGKHLFALVSAKGHGGLASAGELWSTDLESGRLESVLPDVSMETFDLSPDGSLVTYSARDPREEWHVWMAALDRRTPPKQIGPVGAYNPCFGEGGNVYFRMREGNKEFLYVQGPKDPTPRKASQQALTTIALSPQGDIVLHGVVPVVAFSIATGESTILCKSICSAGWGPGGKVFYIRFRGPGEIGGGKSGSVQPGPGA